MRSKLIGLLLFLPTLLWGCQRSEGRYLEREVSSSELYGDWSLTSSSILDLESLGYQLSAARAEYGLELQPEDVCFFHGVAVLALETGRRAGQLIAPCSWALASSKPQRLRVRFEGIGTSFVDLNLDETKDGRLLLWQHIDDPDLWRYVEYEMSQQPPSALSS